EIFGSEVYKYLFHEKENIVEQNFFDIFRTKRKVQKNIPQQTLRAYRRKTLLRKFRMANADALLRSAALCFYRYDTSWITQSRLSHFLETLREYSFDVDKGVYGLKSEMRKIFVKRGGKYHHFSSIDSCTYQERELSALHLEGAPWTEIQAKKFLISGDPSGLLGTDKDIGKHLFRYRNPHQKKVGRIINFAFCGLRNKLPQTLSNQGIIFPEYPIGNQGKDRRRFIRIIKFRKIEVNPLEEDFFLFDKEADEQSVWLSVSIYVSLEWDEDIEKLKSEVYRQMACVAPFFSPKTFPCIYSTYKELGAIRGDFRDGFIYGNEKPAEFGIKGDSFKTGLKNVFVLNREILPGLGLDGELMAARELIANFL
ncbi:MAG: hypothetical protein KDD52_09820, partial [Bdellovibrionales bacterium]|nr:hypothetical protein [Bdellovibrionales bacterium]